MVSLSRLTCNCDSKLQYDEIQYNRRFIKHLSWQIHANNEAGVVFGCLKHVSHTACKHMYTNIHMHAHTHTYTHLQPTHCFSVYHVMTRSLLFLDLNCHLWILSWKTEGINFAISIAIHINSYTSVSY